MSKRYESKVEEIDYLYDLGIRRSEFKRIVATVAKRKPNFKTDDEWVAGLSSMMDKIRHNPMEDDIKKEALAVSQVCPVCRQPSKPITLMKNRKAYYCATHRAVTPAIVE